jgi:16S rRNA (guanine1207-N2)-methyltransferase
VLPLGSRQLPELKETSMSRRRKGNKPLSQIEVPPFLIGKIQSPLVIILGSPAEVVHLLSACAAPGLEAVCYQLDLYQAERLRQELSEHNLSARVETLPDLWDLPPEFQSAVYLPARAGERELKIDVVDQSYHVLKPRGVVLVWSPYEADPFFPKLLKETYGRVHTSPHDTGRPDTLLWCQRGEDKPRRRHEVTFQVKVNNGPSCRFLSRPGTFSYGRFDNGARALAEVMEIERGDRVVDIGCGCGTNGVFASQQTGAEGFIAFVDSNVRAIALTEHNARANGVAHFQTYATSTVTGPEEDSYDVVVANPPYFANSTIARLFIERARALLTPQGRFFLVTRQPFEVAPFVEEVFGEVEAAINRGYTILIA